MKQVSRTADSVRYGWTLVRHYALLLDQLRSKICDYGRGYFKFLIWFPRIVARAWRVSRRGPNHAVTHGLLETIKVVFINLDRRTDRRVQTELQLTKLGVGNVERFRAVPHENGSLGCARSHLQVISDFGSQNGELLMVCEDDVQIDCTREEFEATVQEFVSHPELDILCLGFRLRAPSLPVTHRLRIANNIQTTLCYIVKLQAREKLELSFRRSENMLAKGCSPLEGSIDQQWKQEQSRDLLFCVPRKNMILHRPSFSDVAKQNKDYEPRARSRANQT